MKLRRKDNRKPAVPLVKQATGNSNANATLRMVNVKNKGIQHLVNSNYNQAEVPDKVNALFGRYYQERDEAKQMKQKITAIVKLI